MVTIIQYHVRQTQEGKSFVALELVGDVELIQSMNSGRFYATAKKCSIACTFPEEIAKTLIGKQLPGTINRVACDPYSYTLPESKEPITLSHTYTYVPPAEKTGEVKETVMAIPAS